MSKVLTPEAEIDRAEFNRDFEGRGCTCCISPPCSYCTHPGNPDNQREDEAAWVEQFDLNEMVDRARGALSDAIAFDVTRHLREMKDAADKKLGHPYPAKEPTNDR